MLSTDGLHGTEMDSKYDGTSRNPPRWTARSSCRGAGKTVRSLRRTPRAWPCSAARARRRVRQHRRSRAATTVYRAGTSETRAQTLPSWGRGLPVVLVDNIIYSELERTVFAAADRCAWSPSSPSASAWTGLVAVAANGGSFVIQPIADAAFDDVTPTLGRLLRLCRTRARSRRSAVDDWSWLGEQAIPTRRWHGGWRGEIR